MARDSRKTDEIFLNRFGVPIVPHSGGVGLNEYTQHLALINFICISGEKSLLEHINSFREVLVHQVETKDGHFVTPWEAGYSVEYQPGTIGKYEYPNGSFWMSEQGLAIKTGPKA